MSQAIAFINPRLSTHNVGDFFIEDSVKRIIDYDPERSIDVDPKQPLDPQTMARINETDAAVIVGTNLWYRDFARPGRWMIGVDELRQIKVPFVPFGVGTTRHKGDDNGFNPFSLAILRQIHHQCAEGSVRDLRTLEALEEAGIGNARMTGCPTLYRSLQYEWKLRLKASRQIVLTVRKGQGANVRYLVKALQDRDWQVIIAAQRPQDRHFSKRRFPYLHAGTPTLFKYELEPYTELVARAYGAIGWRLHGNMLHLAHGNPSVFFANCSRVRSFCKAYELPCVYAEDRETIPQEQIEEMVDHLTQARTFDGFANRYTHYRAEMADFLTANGLAHNLATQPEHEASTPP